MPKNMQLDFSSLVNIKKIITNNKNIFAGIVTICFLIVFTIFLAYITKNKNSDTTQNTTNSKYCNLPKIAYNLRQSNPSSSPTPPHSNQITSLSDKYNVILKNNTLFLINKSNGQLKKTYKFQQTTKDTKYNNLLFTNNKLFVSGYNPKTRKANIITLEFQNSNFSNETHYSIPNQSNVPNVFATDNHIIIYTKQKYSNKSHKPVLINDTHIPNIVTDKLQYQIIHNPNKNILLQNPTLHTIFVHNKKQFELIQQYLFIAPNNIQLTTHQNTVYIHQPTNNPFIQSFQISLNSNEITPIKNKFEDLITTSNSLTIYTPQSNKIFDYIQYPYLNICKTQKPFITNTPDENFVFTKSITPYILTLVHNKETKENIIKIFETNHNQITEKHTEFTSSKNPYPIDMTIDNENLYLIHNLYIEKFKKQNNNLTKIYKVNYTQKPQYHPRRKLSEIPQGAKIENGKYVCKKKRHKEYIGKSKKNNKGYYHLDMECCLDPDEYPNPWCTYRPGELQVTNLRYKDYLGKKVKIKK